MIHPHTPPSRIGLRWIFLVVVGGGLLSACSLQSLPQEPPPLRDMEEPIALKDEPDDESQRRQLELGSFTGAYTNSAWFEEPDEPGQPPDALEITRVVENSPAAAAGLREGDLLLSARTGAAAARELVWPAQWRKLETDVAPGEVLHIEYERAGSERTTTLTLAKRVAPAERQPAETYRETDRTGIVVRTATEVEARGAGLGTGGGAVLIGMAANSPWRRAGLRFGDLLVALEDQPVDHPQVVLGAIRTADEDSDLKVTFVRDGARQTVEIPLTSRESELTEVSLFGLFSYTKDRDKTETSILLGLFGYESTAAAWKFTLLWVFCASGGDADLLKEVKR